MWLSHFGHATGKKTLLAVLATDAEISDIIHNLSITCISARLCHCATRRLTSLSLIGNDNYPFLSVIILYCLKNSLLVHVEGPGTIRTDQYTLESNYYKSYREHRKEARRSYGKNTRYLS